MSFPPLYCNPVGDLPVAIRKADIRFERSRTADLCPLLGVKRTCHFALHMSAYDPKRTLPPDDSSLPPAINSRSQEQRSPDSRLTTDD